MVGLAAGGQGQRVGGGAVEDEIDVAALADHPADGVCRARGPLVVVQIHVGVVETILAGLRASGGTVATDPTSGLYRVNGEFSLSVIIARCQQTQAGAHRWRLRFDTGLRPDVTLAVRMDSANRRPVDYYLLPAIDMNGPKLKLADDNGVSIDAYRMDTLAPLFALAARVSIPEAA